ncbi:arginine decarboxylase, pyruvoyl-dependent [bacterium]|nr:arginine decarboxylase, pyruvoyl-dependent [bacterium]
MMVPLPTKYFLVKGAGHGNTALNSFDFALLESGVGDTNLVRMSSILPPRCQEIEPIKLPGGALVPLAYATITSSNRGEIISAAVAVGIPENDDEPGVIMEYEAASELNHVEDIVVQMVKDAFEYRGRALKEIKVSGATAKVEGNTSVFAALVLWY